MTSKSQDASGPEIFADRRRYHRFSPETLIANVSVVCRGDNGVEVAPCGLVNISYGGMCFRAPQALEHDRDYSFLIDLRSPIDDCVFVRAHICWIDPLERTAGASFIESSKGWLGSDEPPEAREDEEDEPAEAALSTIYLA